jgi:competence protein ComEC
MRDRLRRRGVPAGAAEALAIPASAQLACAPVVAALSGAVSLVAIPANLLAVPAVAPATLTGVAAAALSPVWPQGAEFAAWLGGWPAWWLVKVAEVGSGVPAGNLPWPSGVWGGLGLAVLLAGVLIGVRWRAVRIWVCVGAAAILVGPVPVRLVTPGWPPPGWIVVACDVGQGDAIVLRAGEGAAVVVDAGPQAGPVQRCLDDLGISRVPVVVFSHFHLDHIGGLDGLMRHRPGRLILPAFADPAAGRQAVLDGAARVSAAVSEASEGEWTIGEVTLRVLPTGRLSGTRSDPNNNSP